MERCKHGVSLNTCAWCLPPKRRTRAVRITGLRYPGSTKDRFAVDEVIKKTRLTDVLFPLVGRDFDPEEDATLTFIEDEHTMSSLVGPLDCGFLVWDEDYRKCYFLLDLN
jgi:hypothetical protein